MTVGEDFFTVTMAFFMEFTDTMVRADFVSVSGLGCGAAVVFLGFFPILFS